MTRLTAGRAEVLSAQAIADLQGTAMILAANTPGSAFLPANCIGMLLFSPNVSLRVRVDNHASTAVIPSGYFIQDVEHALTFNPGVSFISLASISAGTPLLTWIIGAGA